ncbi:MAG TPA: DNA gyrase C-terminal beta-propeller domain-containing protein, partial [Ktedonobacteraceae bacterium]|nr:DNA gyrase C-terminal beta-propeller domain-containing protein [Ktedonobacteraceae bacterium]
MQQLIKQFGDERRTTIDVEGHIHTPIKEVASLHERQPLSIAFTRAGALKALPPDTYLPKGKNGAATYTPVRGDEQLRQIVSATSQDYVLCVSSSGRVFQLAAHRIPAATRSGRGEPVRKLLDLTTGEEIITILPIESYDEDRYLVTFSKLGKVKKSPLSDYKTADVDGLLDMKLVDGDAIVTALISRGQGEYFVTTNTAQTLRFSDDALRAQGRVGQGVASMALGQNAHIVSASYLDSELATSASNFLSLLVITESGLGKKVPVSQYPQKGRATAGVVTTELLDRDQVLQTTIISEDDTLLITWNGDGGEQVSVIKATELKAFPRARKGMPLVSGHV